MENPISLGNIPGPNYIFKKILDLNYNEDVEPLQHDIRNLVGERSPILNAPEFLEKINSFLYHLPQQWLYCVWFESIPRIYDDEAEIWKEFDSFGIEYENQNDLVKNLISNISNQRGLCWLAHDIGLPGESLELSNGEFDNNPNRGGFMSSPVLNKRNKFEEVKIAFMETNASFGDLIIRPWLKLSSHAGLLARESNDPLNCKRNLHIDFYSKAGPNSNIVRRKSYYFNGVIPIAIEGETKTYGSDSDIKSESRTCKFIYNYYKITSDLMNNSISNPRNLDSLINNTNTVNRFLA